MFNQFIIIGRVASEINSTIIDSGKKVLEVSIAVTRSFKNVDGTYDTDFLKVRFWEGLASNVEQYCKKGNLINVVGRLQIRQTTIEDKKLNLCELIAERVTFLPNNKKE